MEGPTPVSARWCTRPRWWQLACFLVARFFPSILPGSPVRNCRSRERDHTVHGGHNCDRRDRHQTRVLAYSTVSQLGYMMLALGVGGWLAGVMHLFTHAFFKSLVVHVQWVRDSRGAHERDARDGWLAQEDAVDGLYTMLIGCLAIAGAGLPFALTIVWLCRSAAWGSVVTTARTRFSSRRFPLGTRIQAGDTFFFVSLQLAGPRSRLSTCFALWYLTFAGAPRNQDRFDHAHESPPVMYLPLGAVGHDGDCRGLGADYRRSPARIVALLVIRCGPESAGVSSGQA